MLDFTVNEETCTRCGECVADCPTRIISMEEGGYPSIAGEAEASCYRCQHCLAVCPTGSVSILGRSPKESLELSGQYPAAAQLEVLVRGRRSVRRYRQENLDPGLITRLLESAWYAPTGINTRQVRFTVVDDRDKMARLRDEVMAGLAQLVAGNALPEGLSFFADIVRQWEEHGVDTVFRGAPHLLIASAPQGVVSPLQDTMIALSYFELLAQASGVGTVWSGLAKWAIADLVPQTRRTLGIPEDHLVGYAMAFGPPAVHYARTVQHAPAIIHRV
ncbi:MAG TPA: nitroreductase family protein [Geomonas sp.]|nr:nitroreductase family protein [Geomonas sp.]